MRLEDYKLVGRNCTYNFVHTKRGVRQSNGHVMPLPAYVSNRTDKIIEFIQGVLAIQGYREVSGLELDIEEFYEELHD